MARRRANYQVITGVVSAAVLIPSVGYLFWKDHRPANPAPYIAAGDACLRKGDIAGAITNISHASELLPDDATLHLKLGKAYYESRTLNGDNFTQAVAQFTKAEELQPDSKDAWLGLYHASEFLVSYWEEHPNDLRDSDELPKNLRIAREAAEHLLHLDHDNVEAQAAEPILTIRTWLLSLAMPRLTTKSKALTPDQQKMTEDQLRDLTPDQIADGAVYHLTLLMRDHPENDKIPFWIARDKIFQGQQLLKTDHPQDAAPLFSEAADQFDESISKRPDVVGLYLNKASIIRMLMGIDPDPHALQEYSRKRLAALDKAQALVNADKNPMEYQLAKEQWAMALRSIDPAKAETVYRDLMTRFPDSLGFRVALAEFLELQPSRRKDAVKLMDEVQRMAGPPVTNVPAREAWDNNQALCKLIRANAQTDELASTPTGKARTDLENDIRAAIEALKTTRLAQDYRLLALEGRFQLATGQVRDAIITLTQAADKMLAVYGSVDYHLLTDEAKAYESGKMLGKAVELLEKALLDPNGANNPGLHYQLADLNIRNQDCPRAKPYVDWLVAQSPDEPSIIELQIRAMGPTADWAVVKPLFDRLPEKQHDDIVRKYRISSSLHNRDESIRLLLILHKNDPGDVEATVQLTQDLFQAGRLDEAKAVLAEAEKIHPDDPTLKLMEKVASNASPGDINHDEEELLKATKDPFTREMKLSDFYRAKENPEEEMVHLKAALAIDPDNRSLLSTIFQHYIESKRFSDAEAMIPHMAQVDVDSAHGLMLKTTLALAKPDVPNALIYSRQMTHDYPDFGPSWELYGEALRASGQLDSACQQFSTAIAMAGTDIKAWQNLITCNVQQGKLEDAKGWITKACERFPSDPAYRQMQVEFEILYGDPTSVLKQLSESIQTNPDVPQNYSLLANALLASMRAKAQIGQADAANEYQQQALDVFQKAMTRWPDDIKFATALSNVYVENQDYNNAEKCLKTLLARPQWQKQPYPLIHLAQVYRAANKLDLAESTLHQALDIDPRSVSAILELAACEQLQHKYDDELATLQPATRDLNVMMKYTDLLVAMGRGSQAEVELEDAIKANPTNLALVNVLLHIYDSEGNYDQGIRAATRDIQNDPRNFFAYLWRGKMESEGPNPDLDAAIKDLTGFRDSVRNNTEGRILLARAYDMKYDRDSAIRELEAAQQFDPQNRQVRFTLVQEYLSARPSRLNDADRLLTDSLALPSLRHDWEFEDQAAMVWSQKGENDKAVATIQDAMQHTAKKSDLTHDYFAVLLQTKDPKYLQLLLDESNQYLSDPRASWFIFNDRGCAKAGLLDRDGAATEFVTAMDRASSQAGGSPQTVATSVSTSLGVDKALEMVLPRAKNSVTWKVIAIGLYINKGELTTPIPLADSALLSADSLSPEDRARLYEFASLLYINANPRQLDKAVPLYQKILATNPNDITALDNMACVLSELTADHKWNEALAYSQKAYDLTLKSGRNIPNVSDTQGWILVNMGQVEQGITILQTALDQADFPEIHYHLAAAYVKANVPGAANEELSKAREMIAKKQSDHQYVDPTLQDKLEAVEKQIDDLAGIKPSGKAAS